jgi:hypothetical protein
MSGSDRRVTNMAKNKAQKAQEDAQAHALGTEQKIVLKKLKAGELTEAEATQAMKDLKAKYPLGVGVHPSNPPAAEQPKAAEPKAATQPATPAQPSKQDATIEKLKAGWTAKGVDLSKMTIKDDGKFKLLVVGEGWPTVQVGNSGGITVLELKSYPDAFTGAMEGLERYTKQQSREAKQKAAAAAPAPAVAKSEPAPAAVAVKTKAA